MSHSCWDVSNPHIKLSRENGPPQLHIKIHIPDGFLFTWGCACQAQNHCDPIIKNKKISGVSSLLYKHLYYILFLQFQNKTTKNWNNKIIAIPKFTKPMTVNAILGALCQSILSKYKRWKWDIYYLYSMALHLWFNPNAFLVLFCITQENEKKHMLAQKLH